MNDKPTISLEKAIYLKKKLEEIYFPNDDKKVVYDSNEVKQFLDIINSEEVGIPKGTSPKQIGIKLEEWIEFLQQGETTTTEIPQYEAQTTTTGLDLETKVEQAEKRAQQKADIQAREKQTVESFIKQNEERIAKAKSLQEQLNNKVVYAKVVIPDPLPLDEIEKEDLKILRTKAQTDREQLIEDLTNQIETKLQNIPDEQKELIARTAAVELVEKLAKPETQYEAQIQNSILTAIHEDRKEVLKTVLQKDDDLLAAAKNGSTLLGLKNRHRESTTRDIAINIFGPKLTLAIYGPEQFEVVLSETKNEGETHEVSLGDLNQKYIETLGQQNSTMNAIKELGIDKTQNFFTGQARTYITEKMASMPAGSVIKKAYSDPIVQSIFARYGLANPVVWQAAGNSQFINLAMRFAPDTAGPLLNFAGRITGNEFVTPIVIVSGGAVGVSFTSQAVSTYTSIAITDIMAAEAFAGGVGTASQVAVKTGLAGFIAKIATAIGISSGAVTFGISTAVTAVAVAIGKKINWPKIKKWFRDNKEVFVMAGAGVGLMVGGPVAGLVTGGLLMATTGTLGVFAVGAFNLFGVIGRSVGVTIATPVIVTLVTIPPLVAFIMLVINNSAYVVPQYERDRSNPPELGVNIMGGLVSKCTNSSETGADITEVFASQIRGGIVKLLPNTVWGRTDGICITPTMIIMHWSGGTNDNPDGNQRTYDTLVSRNLSCQLGTDTNDVWLMEKFFEKQVEFPACAGEWNTYSINNEMAGVYFTANPPPPNTTELELSYDATCKIMKQYNIPWSQIYGHYHVPNSGGKPDPGKDFLEKVFIPEIKRRCPNGK